MFLDFDVPHTLLFCTLPRLPLFTAEVVCRTDELSTLCTLVGGFPDLVDALSDPTATFTLFAPNNDAFMNIDTSGLDSDGVLSLLQFHALADEEKRSTDLVCDEMFTMVNGEVSTTTCDDNADPMEFFQAGAANDRASPPQIIRADTECSNGVIHILDEVMLFEDLPPP